MNFATKFGLLTVLFVGASVVQARDYNYDLAAGERVIIPTESGFDRHFIRCTADPQTPTVMSRSCTCTSRYIYDRYYYVLTQQTALSNGRTVSLDLADRLATIEACNTQKKDEYSADCRSTRATAQR